MRKLISVILFSLVVLCAATPAFASAQTHDAQAQIDNTLDAVFEYLGAQTIRLDQYEETNYIIPVDDNNVTVTISSQQVPKTRGVGVDYLYNAVENQSYIYTLTIRDFYLSSGTITYKIYFDTGSTLPGSNIFPLTVTDVDVNAVAPSTCSVAGTHGYVDGINGNIIVETVGYAQFSRALLSDFTVNIGVKFGLLSDRSIQFNHYYN